MRPPILNVSGDIRNGSCNKKNILSVLVALSPLGLSRRPGQSGISTAYLEGGSVGGTRTQL